MTLNPAEIGFGADDGEASGRLEADVVATFLSESAVEGDAAGAEFGVGTGGAAGLDEPPSADDPTVHPGRFGCDPRVVPPR